MNSDDVSLALPFWAILITSVYWFLQYTVWNWATLHVKMWNTVWGNIECTWEKCPESASIGIKLLILTQFFKKIMNLSFFALPFFTMGKKKFQNWHFGRWIIPTFFSISWLGRIWIENSRFFEGPRLHSGPGNLFRVSRTIDLF